MTSCWRGDLAKLLTLTLQRSRPPLWVGTGSRGQAGEAFGAAWCEASRESPGSSSASAGSGASGTVCAEAAAAGEPRVY